MSAGWELLTGDQAGGVHLDKEDNVKLQKDEEGKEQTQPDSWGEGSVIKHASGARLFDFRKGEIPIGVAVLSEDLLSAPSRQAMLKTSNDGSTLLDLPPRTYLSLDLNDTDSKQADSFGRAIQNLTVAIDIKLARLPPSGMCLLNFGGPSTRGDVFVSPSGGVGGFGRYGDSKVKLKPGNWSRVLVVLQSGLISTYINGRLCYSSHTDSDVTPLSWTPPSLFLFASSHGQCMPGCLVKLAFFHNTVPDEGQLESLSLGSRDYSQADRDEATERRRLQARALTLRPLYNRPPPIWAHSAFLGLFGECYLPDGSPSCGELPALASALNLTLERLQELGSKQDILSETSSVMPDSTPLVSCRTFTSDDLPSDCTWGECRQAASKPMTVAMYFGAHWCMPCRSFMPQLASTADCIRSASKDNKLQVIFCSLDRDIDDWKSYVQEMPNEWLAVPFTEQRQRERLATLFAVESIPCVVILDAATGKVIRSDGVQTVKQDPLGEGFPNQGAWAAELVQEIPNPFLGGNVFEQLGISSLGNQQAIQQAIEVLKTSLMFFNLYGKVLQNWEGGFKLFTQKVTQQIKNLAPGEAFLVPFELNGHIALWLIEGLAVTPGEFEAPKIQVEIVPWIPPPNPLTAGVEEGEEAATAEVEAQPTAIEVAPIPREDVESEPEDEKYDKLETGAETVTDKAQHKTTAEQEQLAEEQRTAQDQKIKFRVTIINLGWQHGAELHPASAASQPDLRLSPAIVLESVRLSQLSTEIFWLAVLKCKVEPRWMFFYETLLPFVAQKPLPLILEQSKTHPFVQSWFRRIRSSSAFHTLLVGMCLLLRRSFLAPHCASRHPEAVAKASGMADELCQRTLLMLRVTMVQMTLHDLQFFRKMTDSHKRAVALACKELSYSTVKTLRAHHGEFTQFMLRVRLLLEAVEASVRLKECSDDLSLLLPPILRFSEALAYGAVYAHCSSRGLLPSFPRLLHHPLLERFSRNTSIDGLAGQSVPRPYFVPINLLQCNVPVTTFEQAEVVLLYLDEACALLINQQGRFVKNGALIRFALLQHVFLHVLPVPLPWLKSDAIGQSKCVWKQKSIKHHEQLGLLILLERLLAQYLNSTYNTLRFSTALEGAAMVLVCCIAAISDCLIRKIASDVPSKLSLALNGYARRDQNVVYVCRIRRLALLSEDTLLHFPQLAIARCACLDYFDSLFGGTREGDVGFVPPAPQAFNTRWLEAVPWNARRIEVLTRLEDTRQHSPNPEFWGNLQRDVAIGVGMDPSVAVDAATLQIQVPELRLYFEVFQHVKIFVSASYQFSHLPATQLLVCQRAPSPLSPFLYTEELRQVVHIPPGNTSAYYIWQRMRAKIVTEDDILHEKQLFDFDGAVGQRDAELLISFLTAPYLRLPLLLSFFATEERIHALKNPHLRGVLEAACFEPGPFQRLWSRTELRDVPVIERAEDGDEVNGPKLDRNLPFATPFGALFTELVSSPAGVMDSLISLIILVLNLDSGDVTAHTFCIILFVARLCGRVDNFASFILDMDKPGFQRNPTLPRQEWWKQSRTPEGLAVLLEKQTILRRLLAGKTRFMLRSWLLTLRRTHDVPEELRTISEEELTQKKSQIYSVLLLIHRNYQPRAVDPISIATVSSAITCSLYMSTRFAFNAAVNGFSTPQFLSASPKDSEIITAILNITDEVTHNVEPPASTVGLPEIEIFESMQYMRGEVVGWLNSQLQVTQGVVDKVMNECLFEVTSTKSTARTVKSTARAIVRSLQNPTATDVPDEGNLLPDSQSDDENDTDLFTWNEMVGTGVKGRYAVSALSVAPALDGGVVGVDEKTQTTGVEVDLQIYQLQLKSSHLSSLPPAAMADQDVIDVLSQRDGSQVEETSLAMTQVATIRKCVHLEHLRVVGRALDFFCWDADKRFPPLPMTYDKTYAADDLESHDQWLIPLVEPLARGFLRKHILLMSGEPSLPGAESCLLVACFWKTMEPQMELLVLRYPGVAHVYELISHGRRVYRQQVFASDTRYSLCEMALRESEHWESPPAPLFRYASGFGFQGHKRPSVAITRPHYAPENITGGEEMLVPTRFLYGCLPSSLLRTHQFWQASNDVIHGYPINRADTHSAYILTVKLSSSWPKLQNPDIDYQDQEDAMIAAANRQRFLPTAHAIVTRTPVILKLTPGLARQEGAMGNFYFDVDPDPTARLTMVNLMFSPSNSALRDLADILVRLDNLSHITAWVKYAKDDQPPEYKVDLIEIPRLKLSFASKRDSTRVLRLFSLDHTDLFISNIRSHLTASLLRGMPHSILLANENAQQFVLLPVSGIKRPRVDSDPFSTQLVSDRTTLDSAAVNTKDTHIEYSRYFLYPIHISGALLFTPTLASSLYLVIHRLNYRDYESTAQLVNSIATNKKLTDEENLFLQALLNGTSQDCHPNAHALRCKVYLLVESEASRITYLQQYLWDMCSYLQKLTHVSESCRLSHEEELEGLDLLCDYFCRPAESPEPNLLTCSWAPVVQHQNRLSEAILLNRLQYLTALSQHKTSGDAGAMTAVLPIPNLPRDANWVSLVGATECQRFVDLLVFVGEKLTKFGQLDRSLKKFSGMPVTQGDVFASFWGNEPQDINGKIGIGFLVRLMAPIDPGDPNLKRSSALKVSVSGRAGGLLSPWETHAFASLALHFFQSPFSFSCFFREKQAEPEKKTDGTPPPEPIVSLTGFWMGVAWLLLKYPVIGRHLANVAEAMRAEEAEHARKLKLLKERNRKAREAKKEAFHQAVQAANPEQAIEAVKPRKGRGKKAGVKLNVFLAEEKVVDGSDDEHTKTIRDEESGPENRQASKFFGMAVVRLLKGIRFVGDTVQIAEPSETPDQSAELLSDPSSGKEQETSEEPWKPNFDMSEFAFKDFGEQAEDRRVEVDGALLIAPDVVEVREIVRVRLEDAKLAEVPDVSNFSCNQRHIVAYAHNLSAELSQPSRLSVSSPDSPLPKESTGPLELRDLTGNVLLELTLADLTAMAGTPLQELNLEDCVSWLTRNELGLHEVKDILPFDVSHHPDSKSTVARQLLARLRDDVVSFAEQINGKRSPKFTSLLLGGAKQCVEDVEYRATVLARLHGLKIAFDMLQARDLKYLNLALPVLLNLANFFPSGNNEDEMEFAFTRKSEQRKRVSLEFVVSALLSTRAQLDLQALNPFLKVEDIKLLQSIAFTFLLRSNRAEQLNRCRTDLRILEAMLAESKVPSAIAQQADAFSKQMTAGRHFMTPEAEGFKFDPRFLVFEFIWSLLLRKQQVQLILDFMKACQEEDGSVVRQMIMGAGKTTVVGPLLCLILADGKRLVAQIVPLALLEFSRAVLRASFSSVLYKKVFTLEMDRSSTLLKNNRLMMHKNLAKIIKHRGIIISTPTYIMSTMLNLLERMTLLQKTQSLGRNHGLVKELRELASVIRLFNEGVLIMDEVDLILHPLRSELNFPVGPKQELDLSPLRWQLPIHILDALFCADPYSENKEMQVPSVFAESKRARDLLVDLRAVLVEGYQKKSLQRNPHLVLLNVAFYHENIKGILISWLQLFMEMNHVELRPSDIRRYVEATPSENHDSWDTLAAKAYLPPRHAKLLNLCRDCLSQFIPHVLQKIDRVGYGLIHEHQVHEKMPDTRKLLAIPFIGKDVPSPSSEFAHPDIVITLSVLAYRYEGLRYSDFMAAFKYLKVLFGRELGPDRLRGSNRLYCKWVLMSGGSVRAVGKVSLDPRSGKDEAFEFQEPEQIAHNSKEVLPLRLLRLSNFQQMQKLFGLLRFNSEFIHWYLQTSIFPECMRYQVVKLSASGQDLGGSNLFRTRMGFSGTPSNLLPRELGECGYEKGTDGQMIHTLTNPEVVSYTFVDDQWTAISLLNFIAKSPMRFHALIDTGALITGLSNLEVAQYLLQNGLLEVDGVVFLDDEDRQMMLVRDTMRVVRLAQSGIPMHRRFAFYDQVHTTGMDIKHEPNALALLTLSKDLTFRDYSQGAFRMRGIGEGQKIRVLVIPEVLSLMRRQLARAGVDSLGEAANSTKPLLEQGPYNVSYATSMLSHIAAWLVVNSMISERLQFQQLILQNLSNLWRKNAFRALLDHSDQFSMTPFPHSHKLAQSLGVFHEPLDFDLPTKPAPAITYGQVLNLSVDKFQSFLTEGDQAVVDEIIAVAGDSMLDAEAAFDGSVVQEKEKEKEQEVEQEVQKEVEIEKFVDLQYRRDHEEQRVWSIDTLREPAAPQFYPINEFRLHDSLSLHFPSYVLASDNYFNRRWEGARRIKNVVMVMEWIAEQNKLEPLPPDFSRPVPANQKASEGLMQQYAQYRQASLQQVYSLLSDQDSGAKPKESSVLSQSAMELGLRCAWDIQLQQSGSELQRRVMTAFPGVDINHLVHLLDSPMLIPEETGRNFVVVSLAEAQTLRRILHLRARGPLFVSQAQEARTSYSIWQMGGGVKSLLMDCGFQLPPPTSFQTQMVSANLRFFDSETYHPEAALRLLLRTLRHNTRQERIRFFQRVTACRRRAGTKWEQTPLARVFKLTDEWSLLQTRVLSVCARLAVQRRGLNAIDAFQVFSYHRTGVISPAELWGGLEWLGLNLKASHVVELVRALDKSNQGNIGTLEFQQLINLPTEWQTEAEMNEEEDVDAPPMPALRRTVSGGIASANPKGEEELKAAFHAIAKEQLEEEALEETIALQQDVDKLRNMAREEVARANPRVQWEGVCEYDFRGLDAPLRTRGLMNSHVKTSFREYIDHRSGAFVADGFHQVEVGEKITLVNPFAFPVSKDAEERQLQCLPFFYRNGVVKGFKPRVLSNALGVIEEGNHKDHGCVFDELRVIAVRKPKVEVPKPTVMAESILVVDASNSALGKSKPVADDEVKSIEDGERQRTYRENEVAVVESAGQTKVSQESLLVATEKEEPNDEQTETKWEVLKGEIRENPEKLVETKIEEDKKEVIPFCGTPLLQYTIELVYGEEVTKDEPPSLVPFQVLELNSLVLVVPHPGASTQRVIVKGFSEYLAQEDSHLFATSKTRQRRRFITEKRERQAIEGSDKWRERAVRWRHVSVVIDCLSCTVATFMDGGLQPDTTWSCSDPRFGLGCELDASLQGEIVVFSASNQTVGRVRSVRLLSSCATPQSISQDFCVGEFALTPSWRCHACGAQVHPGCSAFDPQFGNDETRWARFQCNCGQLNRALVSVDSAFWKKKNNTTLKLLAEREPKEVFESPLFSLTHHTTLKMLAQSRLLHYSEEDVFKAVVKWIIHQDQLLVSNYVKDILAALHLDLIPQVALEVAISSILDQNLRVRIEKGLVQRRNELMQKRQESKSALEFKKNYGVPSHKDLYTSDFSKAEVFFSEASSDTEPISLPEIIQRCANFFPLRCKSFGQGFFSWLSQQEESKDPAESGAVRITPASTVLMPGNSFPLLLHPHISIFLERGQSFCPLGYALKLTIPKTASVSAEALGLTLPTTPLNSTPILISPSAASPSATPSPAAESALSPFVFLPSVSPMSANPFAFVPSPEFGAKMLSDPFTFGASPGSSFTAPSSSLSPLVSSSGTATSSSIFADSTPSSFSFSGPSPSAIFPAATSFSAPASTGFSSSPTPTLPPNPFSQSSFSAPVSNANPFSFALAPPAGVEPSTFASSTFAFSLDPPSLPSNTEIDAPAAGRKKVRARKTGSPSRAASLNPLPSLLVTAGDVSSLGNNPQPQPSLKPVALLPSQPIASSTDFGINAVPGEPIFGKGVDSSARHWTLEGRRVSLGIWEVLSNHLERMPTRPAEDGSDHVFGVWFLPTMFPAAEGLEPIPPPPMREELFDAFRITTTAVDLYVTGIELYGWHYTEPLSHRNSPSPSFADFSLVGTDIAKVEEDDDEDL